MTDSTQPPNEPLKPEHPYRMLPSQEAGDELLRAAQQDAEPTPRTVPFDPTKPTIDQTRSAAIDSIRNNFAALPVGSAGADKQVQFNDAGAYGVDADFTWDKTTNTLTVGTLTASAASGALLAMKLVQAGLTRFAWQINAAGTILRLDAYDAAGALLGSAMNWARDLSYVGFLTGKASFGPIAGPRQGWNVDIYTVAQTTLVVHNGAQYNGIRIQARADGANVIDSLNMETTGADKPIAGVPLQIRTADAAGTLKNRLNMLPTGAMKAVDGNAAFVGSYTLLGSGSFSVDFRLNQTVTVYPGSTVNITGMSTGQVARILVWGSGAITITRLGASDVRAPLSGAVWGTFATMVSLFTPDDAGNVLSNYTAY